MHNTCPYTLANRRNANISTYVLSLHNGLTELLSTQHDAVRCGVSIKSEMSGAVRCGVSIKSEMSGAVRCGVSIKSEMSGAVRCEVSIKSKCRVQFDVKSR